MPNLKTQRVIVVLDLPAGVGFGTLDEVRAWLETEVNDDHGLGPDNVHVYVSLEELTDALDDGDDYVRCTLDDA